MKLDYKLSIWCNFGSQLSVDVVQIPRCTEHSKYSKTLNE